MCILINNVLHDENEERRNSKVNIPQCVLLIPGFEEVFEQCIKKEMTSDLGSVAHESRRNLVYRDRRRAVKECPVTSSLRFSTHTILPIPRLPPVINTTFSATLKRLEEFILRDKLDSEESKMQVILSLPSRIFINSRVAV